MRSPTVESVMTTEVVTVQPDTPFKRIVELLDTNQISAVPVVHADGTPLGVVSEADLMTKPIVTISADTKVTVAARRLAKAELRRLFVVGPDGKLVGVLARRDLLRLFLRPDSAIREDITSEVLARALWADPNAVQVEVHDGVVTLTGRFQRRSEAEMAARLTATRPGVVAVNDQLSYQFDDINAAASAGL
jgi:CBS-domain-containing membrane protein